MSVPPVSSNVHGQLDAQIAQLTQCKPLPEHEVRLVSFGFGFSFVRLWPFCLSACISEICRDDGDFCS